MAENKQQAEAPKASPAGSGMSFFSGLTSFSPLRSFVGLSSGPNASTETTPVKIAPIKTPHNDIDESPSPISHPEMCFSPTDIGIWEINTVKNKRPFS